MTSYIGRHRQEAPKNTVAQAAKVAVVGAAVGTVGFVFSPAANAAPDSDWDRLAQCESGGNWSINTGNGYSGGLQFHPQTWTGNGGGEFAPTAAQASREQQIVVAERVLASQGWGAWPACSSNLGLNSPAELRDAPAPTPEPAPAPAPEVADVPEETTVDDHLDQVVELAESNGYGHLPIADLYSENQDVVDSAYAENKEAVDDFFENLPADEIFENLPA